MKKKIHKSGFGKTEPILAFIIVAAIAFIGWYVWNAKQETEKSLKSSDSSQVTSDKKVTNPKNASSTNFTLDKSKYPNDWKQEKLDANSAIIASPDGKCRAGATLETANAATNSTHNDRLSAVTTTLKKDGYTVREQQELKIFLNTKNGQKDINATQLRVSGNDQQTTYRVYGFLTSGESYVTVQISCQDQNEIPVTLMNSQGIIFNQAVGE